MTIARLTVQRGDLNEYPLAQRTKGGWQNGVTFYPDEEVVKATPLRFAPPRTPEHVVLNAATSEARKRYSSRVIEDYEGDRFVEDEYGYDVTARQAFVAGALWAASVVEEGFSLSETRGAL